MDNTSTTIQARLEAVQAKQAEWQQEFDAVREDARQECLRLCKLFNFTTFDLELEASGKKTAKKATKLPPKFKNPEGEETWTGRGGHKPQWFVDALEAGYTEEDMRIKCIWTIGAKTPWMRDALQAAPAAAGFPAA